MIIKPEHPRPDFLRDSWQSLNGVWRFAFDPKDEGEQLHWQCKPDFPLEIQVPFSYQAALSGIGSKEACDTVWYALAADLTPLWEHEEIRLHFEACDYHTTVWVNGQLACTHTGGYSPFDCDIKPLANAQRQAEIVVRAYDPPDPSIPRGKQAWDKPHGCWYTPTTGIWQTVWLEGCSHTRIESLRITPDIDTSYVYLEVPVRFWREGLALEYHVTFQDKTIASGTVFLTKPRVRLSLPIPEPDEINPVHWWTPESPSLFDLRLRVLDGNRELDLVQSYFGMRKISVRNGQLLLNNKPYFQRLVLDQGYWPDGLLTAPSDEALCKDILLAKAMGFDGCRKHQKMEEARFYYWADKLGFLVWGELPSAYEFHMDEFCRLETDMTEFIRRDYNHPSIVAWVPLNESWGVRNIVANTEQQAAAAALYYHIKALDKTRLVSNNDGWELVSETDFYGVHDYTAYASQAQSGYADPEQLLSHHASHRLCGASNFRYDAAKPVLITEYGGIAFADEQENAWGYNGKVNGEEEFLERFRSMTAFYQSLPYVWGLCYTQLTDVEQETNGLLTPDRTAKVSPRAIYAINRAFSPTIPKSNQQA